VLERLDELFEIGRSAGTNRPGLGAGEQAAFERAAGWMREAGLDVTSDPAGNLVGRLAGTEPGLPEVWCGSHLDTPPDGGRFDGALGVAAAIEALAALADGPRPRRTLAAVAFRLEEGSRFGRGVFGSRALCGRLESDEAELRDPDGVSLGEAFAALGLGELPAAGWLTDGRPGCFVEPHIEQGPALAAAGARLGVVSGIAGMAGMEIAFAGRRGHAGTTPMAVRADALAAAAEFVRAAYAGARALPGAVATVGRLTVSPGATNTIPGRAELFADVRAPDAATLEALVRGTVAAAHAAAETTGCTADVHPRWRYEPVAMAPRLVAAIRRAVATVEPEPVELASGAGHDAAILAEAGVECGMLFVRSDAGGVSHAPQEATGADAVDACLAALAVLLPDLAGA
jgi:allantoate deiminase